MSTTTPDWTAGLAIETTVSLVDPEGLGLCVAELDNAQQAAFLVGLARGFDQYGGPLERDAQKAFIGEAFAALPVPDAFTVCQFLSTLAGFIDEAVAG